MTNLQLYLAIGVPVVLHTIVTVLMYTLLTQQFSAKILGVEVRIQGVERRIEDLDRRMTDGFAAINQRFDDMRDLWRAELGRVEEVLDARLKHLEDHRS